MGATTSKGWEDAFDNWPGWRGNDPIRQAFQAGWDAALASHAPSEAAAQPMSREQLLAEQQRNYEQLGELVPEQAEIEHNDH